MSGPDLPPLPPRFGVVPQPGTICGSVLVGGTPPLRVDLAAAARPVVEALLAGETVQRAAELAGCSASWAGTVARRLLVAGMVGPTAPVASVAGVALADVAAVIPAHDAAGTLATAIAGVAGVGEVVVVDDGSTDETSEVATAAGATVVRNEAPTGPAAARNRGIAATAADIVVLLDSDARPGDGWLARLLPHLADPAVGGVAPRVLTIDDGSVLGGYEAAAGPLDLGPWPATVRPDGPVPFVSTTALVLRRSLWEELGGFDEDLRFGEDLDFAWRAASAGQALVHEPAVVVHHHHRSTLGGHLGNRARYGSAAGPLSRRHGRHPRCAVAPPLLAAAAAAAVAGLPRTAASLTAASLGSTIRRLRAVGVGPSGAVVESLRGTGRAGRGLAAAVSRPWLPALIVLATARRRSRPVVIGAVLLRTIKNRPRGTPAATARIWVALRFLDDLAHSAGVFAGCVRARTSRPLAVRSPSGPARTTSALGTEIHLP